VQDDAHGTSLPNQIYWQCGAVERHSGQQLEAHLKRVCLLLGVVRLQAGLLDKMRARAESRQLSDLTIGPVLTWTTEAILGHMNKLLQVPGMRQGLWGVVGLLGAQLGRVVSGRGSVISGKTGMLALPALALFMHPTLRSLHSGPGQQGTKRWQLVHKPCIIAALRNTCAHCLPLLQAPSCCGVVSH
jgi:hypothetical protein